MRYNINFELQLRHAAFAAACATVLVAGCASAPQTAMGPTGPDPNTGKIIKQLKTGASAVSGGGMIYELFAGTKLSARYNESAKELTLTDIANDHTCKFGPDSILQMPEKAEPGYAQYCANLSANTFEFLKPPAN
jgi:hypothetical protein